MNATRERLIKLFGIGTLVLVFSLAPGSTGSATATAESTAETTAAAAPAHTETAATAATSYPEPEACPYTGDHPALGPGSQGPAVRHLQCLLREAGFDVPLDGVFGTTTRAAVLRFQRSCGLVVDGITGVQFWSALHRGC